MSPVEAAMQRASAGLDWGYPCLLWIADYLRDATGVDYAADWRGRRWSEPQARRVLVELAAGGEGSTAVERALDATARLAGWSAADAQMQGKVMIGVFDGTGLAGEAIGVPAIFDGQDRWIVSADGRGWQSLGVKPKRMWAVPA